MLRTICLIRSDTVDGEPAQQVAADLAHLSGAIVRLAHDDAAIEAPGSEGQAVSVAMLGQRESRERALHLLQSWQPDLVVTSERGVARVRDRLMGSLARRLAQRAPCPVVFVQRTSELHRGPVMLLTGYHLPAAGELEFATAMAKLLGVELVVAGFSPAQAIAAAARDRAGMVVVVRDRWAALDEVARSVLCPVAVVPPRVAAGSVDRDTDAASSLGR